MFLWYRINILCGLGHESALAAALKPSACQPSQLENWYGRRDVYIREATVSQFRIDLYTNPLSFKAPQRAKKGL